MTTMRIDHPHPSDGATAKRSVVTAMRRGAMFRCPACGEGGLYRGYLKIADYCPSCDEALHHQRADDAPPYMTIFAVGHLMIPMVLAIDILYEWPMWLNMLVWFPAVVGVSLIVLPVTKGALVGLQWALRMHGFGGEAEGASNPAPLESRAAQSIM